MAQLAAWMAGALAQLAASGELTCGWHKEALSVYLVSMMDSLCRVVWHKEVDKTCCLDVLLERNWREQRENRGMARTP